MIVKLLNLSFTIKMSEELMQEVRDYVNERPKTPATRGGKRSRSTPRRARKQENQLVAGLNSTVGRVEDAEKKLNKMIDRMSKMGTNTGAQRKLKQVKRIVGKAANYPSIVPTACSEVACVPDYAGSIFTSNIPIVAPTPYASGIRIYASNTYVAKDSDDATQYMLYTSSRNALTGSVLYVRKSNSAWYVATNFPPNVSVPAIVNNYYLGMQNHNVISNALSGTQFYMSGSMRSGLCNSTTHLPSVLAGRPAGSEQEYLIPPSVTQVTPASTKHAVALPSSTWTPAQFNVINSVVVPVNTTLAPESLGLATFGLPSWTNVAGAFSVYQSGPYDNLYGAQQLMVRWRGVIRLNVDQVEPIDVTFSFKIVNSSLGDSSILIPEAQTVSVSGSLGESFTFDLAAVVDYSRTTPYTELSYFAEGSNGLSLWVDPGSFPTGSFEIDEQYVDIQSPNYRMSPGWDAVTFITGIPIGSQIAVNTNSTVAFLLNNVNMLKFPESNTMVSKPVFDNAMYQYCNKKHPFVVTFGQDGTYTSPQGHKAEAFSFDDFLNGITRVVETGAKIAPHVMDLLGGRQ